MTEATLAPPAPAATVMEARAQLDARIADKDWGARLTAGDANTNREFHDLTAMVANEDDSTIAAAMSGAIGDMPDSSIKTMAATAEMFRNLGIRDEVTSQFLRGQQVTSEEYELVSNWRKEHMGDAEFVKLYLSGDVKARQLMTIANSVLVNGVKSA